MISVGTRFQIVISHSIQLSTGKLMQSNINASQNVNCYRLPANSADQIKLSLTVFAEQLHGGGHNKLSYQP